MPLTTSKHITFSPRQFTPLKKANWRGLTHYKTMTLTKVRQFLVIIQHQAQNLSHSAQVCSAYKGDVGNAVHALHRKMTYSRCLVQRWWDTLSPQNLSVKTTRRIPTSIFEYPWFDNHHAFNCCFYYVHNFPFVNDSREPIRSRWWYNPKDGWWLK